MKRFFTLDSDAVNKPAQEIVNAVIVLSGNVENLQELSNLTGALHKYALSTDAYKTMTVSLYSLDEYIDILSTKMRGEVVNETYLNQLRDDLLNGCI